ncbi:glycosyltransferase family 4 protein [Halomonas sp. McH1-25]|uniref:glycosyltransferase family 4 protein n=1 Tax=unclassified Halomonas TaxID=2609666 RepID=UPI001EF6E59E|nr:MULTISPECIES: glycosyltransferase family 4 protein [unclassified Halomonas]MCG7601027.1 glycosyltransferase family 4 protein [Halomonas sp. McH1-25]MCP1342118.1 glycosyltransferase family 4 protein [Halomonas sp. FL8]MCP1360593.1 glycosyltransferase family 4 protein [Halomonas sp. BBD45]MCP1365933.1 glycosyltransferase family 4 protein [Halomonas sp. BBD48]
MKVALVVDWLTVYSGAERVVENIIETYPDADIFSLIDFLQADQRHFLKGRPITTSFIQKLPFAKEHYRNYLPLMPLAIEQLDVSGYDLVISSSHAVAKGIITGPNQVHVCYIHSPIRYAWDLQHQYLQESGLTKGPKSWLVRLVLHRLRDFDARTALGVDTFIANSCFIAKRVNKCYRRDAVIVYPPVNVDEFQCTKEKHDYYVVASRMVPYKRMDLVVRAFCGMPDKKLVVIGDGPEFSKVQAAARGAANVEVKGYLPFFEMKRYMQDAKAFVFAAEEDFGITPVEAMACGTPVIAFGKGGVLESVVSGETGLFFEEQSESSIKQAVNVFEENSGGFTPEACRKRAEEFSSDVFKIEFKKAVEDAISLFLSSMSSAGLNDVKRRKGMIF